MICLAKKYLIHSLIEINHYTRSENYGTTSVTDVCKFELFFAVQHENMYLMSGVNICQ